MTKVSKMKTSSTQEINFIPKGWGFEKWIHNSDLYCGKLLYFVKGKGNLIIEWNDHRHKHGYWTIPIEAGKYVLFNSDLNYYLEESPTNELRMYLNFNCQLK